MQQRSTDEIAFDMRNDIPVSRDERQRVVDEILERYQRLEPFEMTIYAVPRRPPSIN